MNAAERAEALHFASRVRAAALQKELGIMVSASSSNGWKGAFAVVDFDGLSELAARLRAAEEFVSTLVIQEGLSGGPRALFTYESCVAAVALHLALQATVNEEEQT